ncbi:hypothetical protein P692DRAFT_20562998 [Suillus brevipes Sb2]|nr:hypothetical protein P692DRAFT_20562998 [Suillus brevipes Sb2]
MLSFILRSMFGLVLRHTSERCFWDSPGILSYTLHTILFLVFMTLGDGKHARQQHSPYFLRPRRNSTPTN